MFELDLERSKFVDWQRIRVQENSDEIPAGSMPRTMDIVVRHEMVDRAKAGDKCTFTGMLVVIPDVYRYSSFPIFNFFESFFFSIEINLFNMCLYLLLCFYFSGRSKEGSAIHSGSKRRRGDTGSVHYFNSFFV